MNGTLYSILACVESFLQDRLDLLIGKVWSMSSLCDAPIRSGGYTNKIGQDVPVEYYDPRPEAQTKPIVTVLRNIGHANPVVNMDKINPEVFVHAAYEFLDIYEKQGRYALLVRLNAVQTMDNLDRLQVLKAVKKVVDGLSVSGQTPA